MLSKVAVCAFALLAGSAGAQRMYRCGNTFSQQPCGPDAMVIEAPGVPQPKPQLPLPPDVPAAPEVIEAAKAACLERLFRDLSFRDPDSVKVGNVHRSILFRHNVIGVTRIYSISINAKNGYGGYTGFKFYSCYTDPSNERTVYAISAPH